ncbi:MULTISPECIES: acyl carrier protein [unclassified Lentimonas]|uniref:acyl carrier protein n=1 Tax=unclassified Lentimonas TaxID=2630993 RepID=UPI0013252D98|nr:MULTISPECIES: phosphopantetheine-binding protein [unclassified Lentimonas]CAA6694159.1 Unannotated [Lentimonas sp. CC10]CAA6694341.1 Unannotated [Lentimonas sp. CC19]CAA7071094.1 Unannotated [Lentimonas sp. CC11]
MSIESLKAIVADLLDVEPSVLKTDTIFNAQGDFDSLKVVLLMAALEEDFDLSVPPQKAWELNTLQSIVDFATEKGIVVSE